LTGLGHCVGACLFLKAYFDEKELFTHITAIITQMEKFETLTNDLFSFYKEFDELRDQMSLVNTYVCCNHITPDKALNKLTADVIACSEQLVAVLKDKDSKIADSLHSFMPGYVT
jgi:hypothetical protein